MAPLLWSTRVRTRHLRRGTRRRITKFRCKRALPSPPTKREITRSTCTPWILAWIKWRAIIPICLWCGVSRWTSRRSPRSLNPRPWTWISQGTLPSSNNKKALSIRQAPASMARGGSPCTNRTRWAQTSQWVGCRKCSLKLKKWILKWWWWATTSLGWQARGICLSLRIPWAGPLLITTISSTTEGWPRARKKETGKVVAGRQCKLNNL